MVDARGLSCPLPVLQVKKVIESTHPDTLEVLVDNPTAVQNLLRFAAHADYAAAAEEREDDEFSIVLTKK